MSEKVIGILGGMGPEATLQCYDWIIRNTPAQRDQDHLRVIIVSDPKVPDRTEAILGRGESPVPALLRGARALERAGADFIIIPCVSAHYFLDELKERVEIPILSIFDVVAEYISCCHPRLKRVGLLATTGTIRGGSFQRRLEEEGLEVITCNHTQQDRLMRAIYEIKAQSTHRGRDQVRKELKAISLGLIDNGAQGIIAGCTEVPLAMGKEDLPVPLFDTLLLLARAAIRMAGREPTPAA
jgi:aspartate racemase